MNQAVDARGEFDERAEIGQSRHLTLHALPYLKALGRPSTAFAACELRSAAPFTEQGFHDFNREYVKTLARWGIYKDEINPVARTNVWDPTPISGGTTCMCRTCSWANPPI